IWESALGKGSKLSPWTAQPRCKASACDPFHTKAAGCSFAAWEQKVVRAGTALKPGTVNKACAVCPCNTASFSCNTRSPGRTGVNCCEPEGKWRRPGNMRNGAWTAATKSKGTTSPSAATSSQSPAPDCSRGSCKLDAFAVFVRAGV